MKEFADFITQHTGRPCGLEEVPDDATLPFFVIHQMPSFERTGTLEKPNKFEERNYQMDTVGASITSVEDAEGRMVDALNNTLYRTFDSVMGVPVVRHNGGGREDDRRYRRMTIVTMMIDD
jgi:hypothetical protein